MGEIPERSTFRMPIYRKALHPYLELTQSLWCFLFTFLDFLVSTLMVDISYIGHLAYESNIVTKEFDLYTRCLSPLVFIQPFEFKSPQ